MYKVTVAERVFTMVALLLYNSAFIHLLTNTTGQESIASQSNAHAQLLFSLITVVTTGLVLRFKRTLRVAIRQEKGLLLLFAVVALSICWSSDPFLSARRVVGLLGTSLFGYYIAIRYTLPSLLQLLHQTLCLIAILSVAFALFLPAYGVMDAVQEYGMHEGAWKGIFSHKNSLGRLMVLFALLSFILFTDTHQKKYGLWGLLAIGIIIMTQSSSALILVVFIIGFSYAIRLATLQTGSIVFILLTLLTTLIGLALLVGTNPDSLFALFGKDATLTGRTVLWGKLIEAVQQRPLFGYGFGGFWAGPSGPSSHIVKQLDWEMTHSHNGFLDIVLEIGYIGLILFMGLFMTKLFGYIRQYSRHHLQAYLWGIMYLVLFLVYNTVESNALRQNNFWWVIFVATLSSYSLNRRLSQQASVPRQPLASIPILSPRPALKPAQSQIFL